EDREDGREDGPVDEESGEHGYFFAAGFGCCCSGSFFSAMRTGAPGPSFITPSVITLSPWLSPLVMIQFSPAHSPTSTGRGWAVPFSSTVNTILPPCGFSSTARCGTATAFGIVAPFRITRTNWP